MGLASLDGRPIGLRVVPAGDDGLEVSGGLYGYERVADLWGVGVVFAVLDAELAHDPTG